MLGLSRYEVASPSSGTDRAYEHHFRCLGNKTHRKCLPSQILTDSPGRECWTCADEGTRIWAALWKNTCRLALNKSGDWITVQLFKRGRAV